jgi:hypothetical protein
VNRFWISLGIGVAAGVVDVVPMVIQRLDRYACVSAFVHWVVTAVLISYVEAPLSPWLKGLLIGELSALPVVILVSKYDTKGIVPIFVFSAMLGAAVGAMTAKFAK